MASKTPRKFPRIAPITPEEAKRLVDLVDNAIYEFEGNVDHLESAIGMLFLGRYVGWKPLVLVHNKNTVRRNEKILGIEFRKFFAEETPRSEKLFAYKIAKAVGEFWKFVSGDKKIEGRKKVQT